MACFKGASPLSVQVGGAEGAGIGPPPEETLCTVRDLLLPEESRFDLPSVGQAPGQTQRLSWKLWKRRSPGLLLSLLSLPCCGACCLWHLQDSGFPVGAAVCGLRLAL